MKKLLFILLGLLLISCTNITTFTEDKATDAFKVDCTINNIVNVTMMVDTGASELNITPDIYAVLVREGTIREKHLLPSVSYILADGSKVTCKRVMLDRIYVNGKVITDIEASISNNMYSPVLFGQSGLRKLKKVLLKY